MAFDIYIISKVGFCENNNCGDDVREVVKKKSKVLNTAFFILTMVRIRREKWIKKKGIKRCARGGGYVSGNRFKSRINGFNAALLKSSGGFDCDFGRWKIK